tara:strand:- start:844 stop:1224 length:381 start_codon:yes stop_codon:yes gene_type:complete
MKLVKNNQEYWEFIRNLRNHPSVKEGFVFQDHITEEQQIQYMSKHNDCFYICLINEEPAGYVGVIDKDIRVATHPDFQGKGVGKYMINQLMEIHPNAYAKVKIKNEASLKLFEKCGFKKKFYILEK